MSRARGRGAALTLESSQLARTAALLAIMWAGYGLILLVGFVLGGAFLVFSYAWLLQARNRAAVVAALAAPLLTYLCLEHACPIRLPSLLDRKSGVSGQSAPVRVDLGGRRTLNTH